MKIKILSLFSIVLLFACNSANKEVSITQPTIEDFQIGETWVWKYKGVTTEGVVRSDGTDTRTIVDNNGTLSITIGQDTVPVANIVKPDLSETPKYDWPLEVGKKWKYEESWTSQDGTTGSQNQDAEVLSYKDETVGAGTFKAFTIKYEGTITNSRGYSAKVSEVWLYAPAVKNFIKLTQSQDDFLYEEELIEYSKPE